MSASWAMNLSSSDRRPCRSSWSDSLTMIATSEPIVDLKRFGERKRCEKRNEVSLGAGLRNALNKTYRSSNDTI